MRALALLCIATTAAAEPATLVLDHQPATHLKMRPHRRAAQTTPASAPSAPPKPAEPAPQPVEPASEPARVRDLSQRVSARVNLGYVVDGTQLNAATPVFAPGAHDNTTDAYFSKIRAYGFGEGYLSTHGVAFDSLSSYFAGRWILVHQNERFAPNSLELQDTPGNSTRPPPVATWFERSGFEPRAAWIEAKDFMPQKWLAPLRIRGGEQYVYGPWVLHFYGAVAGWDGKLVRGTLYGGSYVPDYTFNPALPSARAAIGGGSIKFDLRDLDNPLPITLGAESVNLSSGTGSQGTNHNQYEVDWRPRRDFALIAQARQLAGKFVNEHVQLRARYHEVTNLVFDLTHRSSTDWRWDPTVIDPDPVAAKRYLDLGPVLPQLLASARAGTLIAENIDVYARGAVAADLARADAQLRDTYSASYLEGGGALEVRLRRTIALGASLLSRQTVRDDQVSAEIIDVPNQPDAIPVNASSQMGERGFSEAGLTARLSLGARKFSMLFEVYGRRTRYTLDYCDLPMGASDCRSALDTGIASVAYRGGGRVQIDAWIGNRLRLFASYDLSSPLDFTPNITGYKSLRLVMEGIY
jgi:hypothetical protein